MSNDVKLTSKEYKRRIRAEQLEKQLLVEKEERIRFIFTTVPAVVYAFFFTTHAMINPLLAKVRYSIVAAIIVFLIALNLSKALLKTFTLEGSPGFLQYLFSVIATPIILFSVDQLIKTIFLVIE